MAKKRFYEGSERRMEKRDSGMLSEDKSAVANMPQGVKHVAWPSSSEYGDYSLDDTIAGIDAQMREDVSVAKRHKSKSKY